MVHSVCIIRSIRLCVSFLLGSFLPMHWSSYSTSPQPYWNFEILKTVFFLLYPLQTPDFCRAFLFWLFGSCQVLAELFSNENFVALVVVCTTLVLVECGSRKPLRGLAFSFLFFCRNLEKIINIYSSRKFSSIPFSSYA